MAYRIFAFSRSFLRPLFRHQYFLPLTILIAVVVTANSFIEYYESRNDLYHLLNEEARSLTEAIQRSSENILMATEELEQQIESRLLSTAQSIVLLDRMETLTPVKLHALAEEYGLRHIKLFSSSGRLVVSNEKEVPRVTPPEFSEALRSVLEGKEEYVLLYDHQSGRAYPSVLIARRLPKKGALFIELSTTNYAELRKIFGIGKLMVDLGKNAGVHYAVLQDSLGILAASGAVKELTAFESDPFL